MTAGEGKFERVVISMSRDIEKNAERFTGFAETYDSARPQCPSYALRAIQNYLGRKPETVVDLGCGTGLSTLAWAGVAKRVIGVEPSADMRAVAEKKAEGLPNVEFRSAFGNDTGLPEQCADAVTCSQSFHWMEPESTLREVNRILKPGGVFAAYDCDWPPVCDWHAEQAYRGLVSAVKKVIEQYPDLQDSDLKWEKSGHLANITHSGHFVYTRELLFHNSEECTALRFIALAESQGSLQNVLKKDPALIEPQLSEFRKTILETFYGAVFTVEFCYRMRIGIKAG